MYLFDDYPWVPYAGSAASIEDFGLLGKVGKLNRVIKRIEHLAGNDTAVAELRAKVKEQRVHYTMHGVIKQIQLFVDDPLGPNGGLLRCATNLLNK